jgi:multiple sugar transport system permease protein
MATSAQASPSGSRLRFGLTLGERRNLINGLLFTLPAIVGLIGFTIYPVLNALYYSFNEYSIIEKPYWVGIENYTRLLTDDPLFTTSLKNTLYFVIVAVPLQVVVAFLLALLLNLKVRGQAFYRTLFYLPSIMPVVATSMLWLWIYNPQYGIFNTILGLFGIQGPGWISSPTWAMPSLILMSVWGVGGWVVIYLAGLQDVPVEMLEAAELDGATNFRKLIHITVPLMSPYILFHVINGLIFGVQYFTEVFIMTRGGPGTATLVYSMYLFQNAFQYFKMGYASAMAWIMFIIVLVATFIVFRTSARRVYYAGG